MCICKNVYGGASNKTIFWKTQSCKNYSSHVRMMMHFCFVNNMFYNYLLLFFLLTPMWRYDINNRMNEIHMKIYHEKKKEENFVDAIIWFISAHVCSSFQCAACVYDSSLLQQKYFNKQFRGFSFIYSIINCGRIIFCCAIFAVNIGKVTHRQNFFDASLLK
jgi:hypothetical protein